MGLDSVALEDEMGCVSWGMGDDGELHGLFYWGDKFCRDCMGLDRLCRVWLVVGLVLI